MGGRGEITGPSIVISRGGRIGRDGGASSPWVTCGNVTTYTVGMTRPTVRHYLEGTDLVITAADYRVRVEGGVEALVRRPYIDLIDPEGARWSRLSLFASVDAVRDGAPSTDETEHVVGASLREDGDDVIIDVEFSSSAWLSRRIQVRCTPDSVDITVSVDGDGRLADVTLLGGDGRLPTGASGRFRSSINAQSLYVPTPTEPVQFVRSAHVSAQLGVVGDADPGRLHGIFSPPPFVFGLGRGLPIDAVSTQPGAWLGLGLRSPIEQCGFTTMRYDALDGGFVIELAYEGHTVVNGTWSSPVVVLRPTDSHRAVVDDYRADLVEKSMAPAAPPAERHAWWQQPLFCGWGAQCADGSAPPAQLATEVVYDRLLAHLDAHAVDPGTVVIDDRWEDRYGSGRADPAHWPDLAAWIAAQHRRGRRVLLWWKAWDPSAAPIDECITDARGRAIAVDPGSAAYRARLTETIRWMLSADGLDADGLKVDFTQRAPSGASLRRASDVDDADGRWGASALHLLLRTIYEAAHAAQHDALVITHAVHPSFGDCADMIRTNDVLVADASGAVVPAATQLRERAAIVASSQPQHLIDTDQWPMQNRDEWLGYAAVQGTLGVPALYYVERIDNSRETIESADLQRIADLWREYRERISV